LIEVAKAIEFTKAEETIALSAGAENQSLCDAAIEAKILKTMCAATTATLA
jgi:hypothetical protein